MLLRLIATLRARSLRAVLFALLAAVAGAPAFAQPQELWRRDTANLAVDSAAVRACLTVDGAGLDGCLNIVQSRCRPDPETWNSASERMCHWRAIAAWEDVMAEQVVRVRTANGAAAASIDAAQTAWSASMIADVRMVSDPYEGGSMQGMIAATERARATAARTIWLVQFARALENP